MADDDGASRASLPRRVRAVQKTTPGPAEAAQAPFVTPFSPEQHGSVVSLAIQAKTDGFISLKAFLKLDLSTKLCPTAPDSKKQMDDSSL